MTKFADFPTEKTNAKCVNSPYDTLWHGHESFWMFLFRSFPQNEEKEKKNSPKRKNPTEEIGRRTRRKKRRRRGNPENAFFPSEKYKAYNIVSSLLSLPKVLLSNFPYFECTVCSIITSKQTRTPSHSKTTGKERKRGKRGRGFRGTAGWGFGLGWVWGMPILSLLHLRTLGLREKLTVAREEEERKRRKLIPS